MANNEKDWAPNIIIKGARILYPNFSGRETQFNRKGDRNFVLAIEDDETAQELLDEGWNIKPAKDAEKNPIEGQWRLFVVVSYKFDKFAPIVHMLEDEELYPLHSYSIGRLDNMHIENIDLEITHSKPYEVNGKTYIKAYLKEMVATVKSSSIMQDYKQYKVRELPEEDDEDDIRF